MIEHEMENILEKIWDNILSFWVNIYKFKTRINNSANSILQTIEKYIIHSSVGKHWETSLYNF